MTIEYADFERIDIRAGRIIKAEPFPKAKKPAFKLSLDFGPLGIKQSSAQITRRYTCAELTGRTVLAVTNFQPRQVADFISEVLVLGVIEGEGDVVLIAPDHEVIPGSRML
jgi:tRNA-binding protein